jgi:hypothetical protein
VDPAWCFLDRMREGDGVRQKEVHLTDAKHPEVQRVERQEASESPRRPDKTLEPPGPNETSFQAVAELLAAVEGRVHLGVREQSSELDRARVCAAFCDEEVVRDRRAAGSVRSSHRKL